MSQVTKTYYDIEGRVTETVDGGGLVTSCYTAQNVTGVNGKSVMGWVKSTTNSAGLTESDSTDYFGHLVSHTDFGGHVSNYAYNVAAEVKSESGSDGSSIAYLYYVNGAVETITDNTLGTVSYFQYDQNGNRIIEEYETTGSNPIIYEDAEITYDALNRITEFKDIGPDVKYAYDAVGNKREIKTTYPDAVTGATDAQDLWYAYDSENRTVMSEGQLTGGNIVIGSQGVSVLYDADGQRVQATYADGHTEVYTYSADGYLEYTKISNVIRAERVNNLLGQITSYFEYNASGVLDYSDINQVYNGSNQLTSDSTKLIANGTTTNTNETYSYMGTVNGHNVNEGVVTQEVQTYGTVTATTTYSYAWWDSAQQSTVQVVGTDPANPAATDWAPGFSNLTYDVNGHVNGETAYTGGAVGSASSNRRLTIIQDAYGQVLSSNEMDGPVASQTQGPESRFYYLNGQRIGDISNSGPTTVSYAQALANRTSNTNGTIIAGVNNANFDENYQAINASYTSSAPSQYTVQNGDTMQSIAEALWGDSSMWYLIANANGMSSSASLMAGESIVIPDKVSNLHNNSSTYQVYNASQAVGNELPVLPPEPTAPPPNPYASHQNNSSGCGGFGQILEVVVTVAVAAIVGPEIAPALSTLGAAAGDAVGSAVGGTLGGGFGAFVGGATGAAAGSFVGGVVAAGAVAGAAASVAGQAVGIAAGAQKGFSFDSVAEGAIAGGISGGLQGALGPEVQALGNFGGGAVNAAITSLSTDAVEHALGLQSHFSWASLGVQALGAGLAQGADPEFDEQGGSIEGSNSPANTLERGIISGGVAALGPGNLSSKLPGIIGNVVGSTIGAQVQADQQQAAIAAAVANYKTATTLVDTIFDGPASPPPSNIVITTDENAAQDANPTDTSVPQENISPAPPVPSQYLVQNGDNLWKIASNLAGPGASNSTINNLKNLLIQDNGVGNSISIGQALVLPTPGELLTAQGQTQALATDQQYQAMREPIATPLSEWDGSGPPLPDDNLFAPPYGADGTSVCFDPKSVVGSPAWLASLTSEQRTAYLHSSILMPYDAAAAQRQAQQMNSLALILAGPVLGWGGIYARSVGAPEATVASATEASVGIGLSMEGLPESDALLDRSSDALGSRIVRTDPVDGPGNGFLEGTGIANPSMVDSAQAANELSSGGANTAGIASSSLSSVWDLAPTARGTAIEANLAQTEYADWFNVGQLGNGKFPLVDFQLGNTLVSLKSVDTTGTTWMGRMEDHIYDLGTNGATVNGNPANMVLDLRVQPGGAPAAQPLVQYGVNHNVTVIIKEYQ